MSACWRRSHYWPGVIEQSRHGNTALRKILFQNLIQSISYVCWNVSLPQLGLPLFCNNGWHLIIVATTGLQYYTLQSQNFTSSTSDFGDTHCMFYHAVKLDYWNVWFHTNKASEQICSWASGTRLLSSDRWQLSPISVCMMQRDACTFVGCGYPIGFTLSWQILVTSYDSENRCSELTKTLCALVDLTNVNHVSYNLMITQKANSNYKVKRC